MARTGRSGDVSLDLPAAIIPDCLSEDPMTPEPFQPLAPSLMP